MYIKLHGVQTTHIVDIQTLVFVSCIIEQITIKEQVRTTMRMLASGCGNNEKVSKDWAEGGRREGHLAPGDRICFTNVVMSSLLQGTCCCRLTFILFVMLTGWYD